jgi:hypothetical protein
VKRGMLMIPKRLIDATMHCKTGAAEALVQLMYSFLENTESVFPNRHSPYTCCLVLLSIARSTCALLLAAFCYRCENIRPMLSSAPKIKAVTWLLALCLLVRAAACRSHCRKTASSQTLNIRQPSLRTPEPPSLWPVTNLCLHFVAAMLGSTSVGSAGALAHVGIATCLNPHFCAADVRPRPR